MAILAYVWWQTDQTSYKLTLIIVRIRPALQRCKANTMYGSLALASRHRWLKICSEGWFCYFMDSDKV